MPPCWSADFLCRSGKQPHDTAFLYIFDTLALKSSHPFRHSEARLKPNAADDRRTFPYSHLLNLFLFLTCGKYTHFFPNPRSFCDGFRHHKDTAELPPAVWLLMPVRHKPLSRLTGCGRLIRIIAPPVPLFSATRTVGSPLYSIRGREEVSLCPCRLIAPCLPHRNDEMRLSLGLCHLRAASSAAPPHGICTRKLVWNCQCSTKEKNPFTNNQVLGGKD